MIVFEHLILQVLARLETDAERLCQEVHRKDKRHEEIELVLAAIERDLSRFEKLSPPIKTDRVAAVHRHIGWVRRGIREGSNNWIEGNSDDIKNNDVRLLKEKIGTYFQHFEFLPLEMRAEIAPLWDSGEYDSAVRKAFLVLKQKAIDKYQMPRNLDGEDMVNSCSRNREKLKSMMMRKNAGPFVTWLPVFFDSFGMSICTTSEPTNRPLHSALFRYLCSFCKRLKRNELHISASFCFSTEELLNVRG